MESSQKQAIASASKTEEWAKANVDYVLNQSYFKNTNNSTFLKYWRYYTGELDSTDFAAYSHITEPLGIKPSDVTLESGRKPKFTAKLRNFNIIKSTVDVLIGEKSKRPINDIIVVANPDAVDLQLETKNKELMRLMMEYFASYAEGREPSELPSPEDFLKEFDRKYKDRRAIIGENALEYIKRYNEIYDRFNDLFTDIIVFGRVASERVIVNDEIVYRQIKPYNVDYHKSDSFSFIEDAEWAVVRNIYTISDIIENYRKFLSYKQIQQLESELDYTAGPSSNGNVNNSVRGRKLEVFTAYWRSKKKIGFHSYFDETGTPVIDLVDETFKPEKDQVVEWEWVDEIWQGTKIGDEANPIYIDMRPCDIQRRSLSTESNCKLPVNGFTWLEGTKDVLSFVYYGIPFQDMYNIYRYKLENSIAKSKDIVMQYDMNALPDNFGVETFFYYMDALGIAFTDSSKEGIAPNAAVASVLDLSNKVIGLYIDLLEFTRSEWERTVGVTRERQGQVGEYQGKSVTERAVMQSAHVTEDVFRKFTSFERRELQGLLDLSKFAWEKGKKQAYVRHNGTQAFLNIDPIEYGEAEYNIFVSNSPDDIQKLKNIKELALPLLQNGVAMSTIAEIMNSDSLIKLQNMLLDIEKEQQKLAEAQARAEQEAQAQMQQQQLNAQREQSELDAATKMAQSAMKPAPTAS